MKSTRRELIKKAAIGGSLLAGMGLSASCSKKEASTPGETAPEASPNGGGAAYVTADNSTAKALGYVEDASTLGPDQRAKKGNVAGSDQDCTNCQFFTPESSTNGAGGKCSLFPGKLVKSKAWCRSWSVKANA